MFLGITTQNKEIIATFRNGQRVTFTTDILELLMNDKQVETIESKINGNYIYINEN